MKTTNTISGSQPAEVNYRSIFEHAVEGIFQSTPEGRFLAVNPALARILGFASPEELLTQRTDIARQGYVRPEDRDEFKRLLAADGSVGGFEYESYRKDGSRLWLSESARAVRDAAGQVICYEGTIEDITARKQAESALAAAADLFERTSAMAKVGGWELDLRTLKVSWTLETCRIHEVDPPVAPVLEAAINFYAPEARPVIQAAVQAGMDHGTPWDLELPLITAKGRRIWVRAQGSAVFEDGKAVKLHGAFQDITQRKQAEAEARANEQRFRALIEHGHDGIVLFAADGSVLYASPSTTNVLGYLTEDIRQHNALEYVHHEWQDAVREQMAESLRRPGVAVLSQGYVRHKDGQWRFLEGTFTNLLHEPGVGAIVCNFRDLTERRLAKQRLAAFAKLGRQLNATYQADEAARTILGVADELLGYDCCTLALYDATTDLCSSLMTVDVLNGQRQEVPSVYENAPPSPRMRRAIAQGAELVLREEPLAFAPG
ncbi:MAG: PAS domain S-box protein, partial [Limisphaerales bacterium]